MSPFSFRDKTVLITGASMGIGEGFARTLHRRGARVVLVARNKHRLQQLAQELDGAVFIARDLCEPGSAQGLCDALADRGLEIDVLINNAGFGAHGHFEQLDLANMRRQVGLNVTTVVELTHLLLPQIRRHRGGILNVASTAAFQPVPYMAVYAATKAFVLSFGEGLWGELQGTGVRVSTLCPGATQTQFFDRAGSGAALGKKTTVDAVVSAGLRGFDRNEPSVIEGRANRFRSFLSRVVTRRFMVKASANLMRPTRTTASLGPPSGSHP